MPQPAEAWLLVGQVPAVVSQEHFDEVQAKLATNRSFARRNNTAHQYLLRALVSCGCCGLACTARAVNGRNLYYLCNGKGHSTFSHRATCCPARYMPAGQLDELVWEDLCALLSEPEPLAAAVARAHGGAWLPQELLARRETLRRGQAHLRQQLERLTDAYLRAVIPLDEYERRRRDLEQRVQALAAQEEQLRNEAARRQQLAGVAASLEAFRARVQRGLAEADFEQRRQLVMLLIDRVIVTDAEVEIRYVLPTSPESEHVRFCHLRKDYFDPVGVLVALADQAVPFPHLAPQVLGLDTGNPHHRAGMPLAAQVGRESAQQRLGVAPVGLDPSGAAVDQYADRVDDVAVHPVAHEEAVQPEPVETRLHRGHEANGTPEPGRGALLKAPQQGQEPGGVTARQAVMADLGAAGLGGRHTPLGLGQLDRGQQDGGTGIGVGLHGGFSSVALGGHQTTRHRSPLAPHVIFCDPHSPWQKGSVENANGRVRRFLPRESPPEALARARLRRLADRLNDTPPALPRLSHAA